MDMADKPLKRYIFASDFDKTLTFNDSGYVLAELVGISTEEFERKAKGMAKINLVQQGAELAYLLLHDPEFKAKVRKEHLREVGKRIRLKSDIKLLYQLLDAGIDGHQFDFYVLSAAPVEIVISALEDVVPADHIYGTEFRYKPSGEIDTIVRATAGYGKVAVLDRLIEQQVAGPDHVIYPGDGSSDIHVMLHINSRDGLTIAVSESPDVSQIAKRTVLSTSALAVLAPILEEVAGWERYRIRSFFEANGMLIQEWERVRTDWLTVRPSAEPDEKDEPSEWRTCRLREIVRRFQMLRDKNLVPLSRQHQHALALMRSHRPRFTDSGDADLAGVANGDHATFSGMKSAFISPRKSRSCFPWRESLASSHSLVEELLERSCWRCAKALRKPKQVTMSAADLSAFAQQHVQHTSARKNANSSSACSN